MDSGTGKIFICIVFLLLTLFSAGQAISADSAANTASNFGVTAGANNVDVMLMEPIAKALPQWRNVRSPVNVDLKGVIRANNQYVAVGVGGTILTSLNGEFWVEQRSGISQTLRAVAYNGSRLWLAVGNSGTIVRSANARIWTPVAKVTDESLFDVVWDGKQFVVAGGGGTILTSPDGMSWESQRSNITNNLQGLTAHEGKLIAVGFGAGTILSSGNGVDWAKQTPGSKFFFNLVSVNWVGDQFMAVGWDEKIVVSPDGESWQLEKTIPASAYLNTVVKLNDHYVAAGTEGLMLVSSDGHSWQRTELPTNEDIWGLAGADLHSVAVGANGTILVLSST